MRWPSREIGIDWEGSLHWALQEIAITGSRGRDKLRTNTKKTKQAEPSLYHARAVRAHTHTHTGINY